MNDRKHHYHAEAAQTRSDLEAIIEIIDQRIYELKQGHSFPTFALTVWHLSTLRKVARGVKRMT